MGVYRDEDDVFVIADIPGLVEGASQGRGLGITFLKHIERTSMLLIVLDAASADPAGDYEVLRGELSSYNEEMLRRRRVLVLNKIDLVPASESGKWEAYFTAKGEEVVQVSALERIGIEALKERIRRKGVAELSNG